MNAATAGGLLGGEASATFAPAGNDQSSGVCSFARVGDPKINLRIEVTVMKSVKAEFRSFLDKCRSDVKPLKAIGNEAVVCAWDVGERVVGRVRDQAFVITLTAPDVNVEKMREAAETVSGNLF
jgi:hypothetical protein